MGNGYHGAGEVVQEVLQPGHRVGVQVVGRLVQQQHVGGRQQQAAQRHTTLFTTGEHANFGIPRRQTQCIGGHFQLAIEVVAIAGLQNRFQLALLGGQRIKVGIRLGVSGIHLIQARLGVLDHADRFFHHFAHGFFRIELRLLRQVTDVEVRHRPCLTFEFGIDAGHDFQQGGLTRAVEAEHADLGAGEERQRDVLEDFPLRRHNFAQPMHGVDVLSHK